jgi:predicted porin
MNTALLAAKLSTNFVLATGAAAGTPASDTPTAGVIVSAAARASTVASDVAASNAAINKAITAVQTLLNAQATAQLNTRLALANMDGYTVRNNNTVMYTSPVMNGLQATVQYNAPTTLRVEGREEVKTTGQIVGLNYAQGKLMAGVAYGSGKAESLTAPVSASATQRLLAATTIVAQATDAIVTTATQVSGGTAAASQVRTEVKSQETLAGASYDLGVAKVGYTYSAKKAKDLTSDLIDRKSHSVNVSAPLSAKVSVWANYADGDQKIAVTNEYDLKAMQVGARYAFSKRTDAYAIYGQNKFDNKAAGAIDTKVTQYAFGLRHSF